jgi:hypothetical protein
VRLTVAILAFLAAFSAAYAQEQEGKLVNRLLRPNVALANSAQNKKFVAPGAIANKTAPAKSFYTPERPRAKTFSNTRAFSPREFAARHFRAGHSTADISTRTQLMKSDTVHPAPDAYPTRAAAGSDNTVASADFAGNRPFLGQGKSQKALRAHDKPLTVEQVRELLNKNK